MLAKVEAQIQEFLKDITGIDVVRADTSVVVELPYVSWGFRLVRDISNPKVKTKVESTTSLKEEVLTTSEYSLTLNFYTDSRPKKGMLASERVVDLKNRLKLTSTVNNLNGYDFDVLRTGTQQNLDAYTGESWERREALELIILTQTGVSDSVNFFDPNQPVTFTGTYIDG